MQSKTPFNAPDGFEWITHMDSWALDDGVLEAQVVTSQGRESLIRFSAPHEDIWRIQWGAQNSTHMISGSLERRIGLELDEDEGKVIVRGPTTSLEIRKAPWRLLWRDPHGQELCRENPEDVDGLNRPMILPLGDVNINGRVRMITETFHLHPDEHLFGLGEKFTALDKRNQRFVSWTVDALGATSERSHKNIPLLMSTRGYGIFANSSARIEYELGSISTQSMTFKIDASALDLFIIYGPDPAGILAQYTRLTGRAPLPPAWSFGLWMSGSCAHNNQVAMEELIDGIDAYDIPTDVINVDPCWMNDRQYCDFEWSRDNFPTWEDFIDKVHQKGFKLCLYEHPYISVESPRFLEAVQGGFLVRRPNGEVYVIDYGLSLSPQPGEHGFIDAVWPPEKTWNAPVGIVDFTNPDAVEWFKALQRPRFEEGVDVFKTDFGEDVPKDAVFGDGSTGEQTHNIYPLLYNQAVFEVTQEVTGQGLVWARSGTAGSQRYPTCWSGDPATDFDSLAATIRGGLSAGLSGLAFWSNDIGGFRGMPTPELYVRWAQFGLFCPHSRMHGDSMRHPWFFGEPALSIVRDYIKLRYQLFPYLFSMARVSSQTGIPMMRSMWLEFPDDPNTIGSDLQYMLGDSLLVAPIYDDGEERLVYLPEGGWYDYWTRQRHDGPRHLHVRAPLDRLPLFVRGGAIIPMMEPANRIPEGVIDPLILDMYPNPDDSVWIGGDGGILGIECRVQRNENISIVWQQESARKLRVRCLVRQKPGDVRLKDGNGAPWYLEDPYALVVDLGSSRQGELLIRF